MRQLAPAGRGATQLDVPNAKSPGFVPAKAEMVNVKGPLPGLLNVKLKGALVVPTAWEPKSFVAGLSVAPGAVPVTLKET
jgi:hypothetical protein